MGNRLMTFGLIIIFTVNSVLADPCPPTSLSPAPALEDLEKVSQKLSGSCLSSITDEDKKLIESFNRELSDLQALNRAETQTLYREHVKQVVTHYQTLLSPPAARAIIAEHKMAELEKFERELTGNPSLGKAYTRFAKAIESYRKKLSRRFGGIRAEKEAKELEAGKAEFFLALKDASLPHDQVVKIRRSVTEVLIDAWSQGSRRAQDAQRWAHFFDAGATVVLSLDLIVLGALTGGLVAPAAVATATASGSLLAATMAATLTGSAAGSASGAGLMGLASSVKVAGHALVNKKESSFFCQLTDELAAVDGQTINNMLIGAAIGGTIGGGIAGIAVKSVAAAATTGRLVGGAFLVKGSYDVIAEGSRAYQLYQAAALAAQAGNPEEAARLRSEANRAAINTVVDGVTTPIGAKQIIKGSASLKPAEIPVEKAPTSTPAITLSLEAPKPALPQTDFALLDPSTQAVVQADFNRRQAPILLLEEVSPSLGRGAVDPIIPGEATAKQSASKISRGNMFETEILPTAQEGRLKEVPQNIPYRKAYQGIRDYLNNTKKVFADLQQLEIDVQALATKKEISKESALKEILHTMEVANGFKPHITLESKSYTSEDWYAMLRNGSLFDDPALADTIYRTGQPHGQATHRLQWYLVMKEMARNPQDFAALGELHPVPANLFKQLGYENTTTAVNWEGTGVENYNLDLWFWLFDSTSNNFTSPEFFRSTHGYWPDVGSWF